MNLLKAALYDPAGAVSKATSALLAMTAFDTTNLRLAITVPAHGMVRFRIRCIVTGATTCPTLLLGVLNGATVVGRVTPSYENATANATTQAFLCDAEFTATGLTPGAMNVDAAYGVEVVVAATNIKYGGPNDTTGNNAWGAFVFEAWDPQPQTANSTLAVDANGRVDVGKVLGTAQTAGDLKASLNTVQADTDDIQTRIPAALVGGRMDSSVGAMAANVLTAAAIAADAITDAKVAADVTIASVTGSVGSVTAAVTVGTINANVVNASALAADAVAEMVGGVWNELTAGHVGVGSTGLALITAGIAGIDAAGVRAAVGLASANLDTQLDAIPTAVENRAEMDSASTGLAAIFARTDVATSSRLATVGYTVPPTTALIADKILGRNLAGGADGGRTMADAMRALRNKTSLAAGVLTVYAEDDTTPAWTAAVTQAVRDPITGVDPT